MQPLGICCPIQILSRIESIQYNHSDDDHSVVAVVSHHRPSLEMRHLHSLQNHKIRLLLHQRATPSAGKLNDAIDTSDFDEQPRGCQGSQKPHQTLVILENAMGSRRSLWASIDTKRVLSGENSKERQTGNLKGQPCELKIVSYADICIILRSNRSESAASALILSQPWVLAARRRANTDLGVQERQYRKR